MHSFEYPIRNVAGVAFKKAVITSDNAFFVTLAADKGHRDTLHVFNIKNGSLVSKIPLRFPGVKVIYMFNIHINRN